MDGGNKNILLFIEFFLFCFVLFCFVLFCFVLFCFFVCFFVSSLSHTRRLGLQGSKRRKMKRKGGDLEMVLLTLL